MTWVLWSWIYLLDSDTEWPFWCVLSITPTCSLLQAEGEDQAAALLALRRPGGGGAPLLRLLPFGAAAAGSGGEGGGGGGAAEELPCDMPGLEGAVTPEGYLRLLPGCLDGDLKSCDGFFVARFIKEP